MTLLTPGVCLVCGCSEPRACPGGCAWANDARTLCTRCAVPVDAAAWRPPPATYQVLRGGETDAILCLRCGAVSHHPADVAQRYCGRCRVSHEEWGGRG